MTTIVTIAMMPTRMPAMIGPGDGRCLLEFDVELLLLTSTLEAEDDAWA